MLRLLALSIAKGTALPLLMRARLRTGSPFGGSTLMTVAPACAIRKPAYGPWYTWPRSMTTTPSSGSLLVWFNASSVLSEMVEPRRIVDQDLSTNGFVGDAFVQKTKQILKIRHRLRTVAYMGPIAAPHDLIGCSLDDGAHE